MKKNEILTPLTKIRRVLRVERSLSDLLVSLDELRSLAHLLLHSAAAREDCGVTRDEVLRLVETTRSLSEFVERMSVCFCANPKPKE